MSPLPPSILGVLGVLLPLGTCTPAATPVPGASGAPAPHAARGPAADDGAFDEVWYDGRAEVAGYRWHGERYGEPRTGEAVAIFVTEPFGVEEHVKIDRPKEASGKVLTALKLNLVRDFQTGIYDYNTMVSVFARADDFTPLKVSFTSAEWCGHVYEELDVRERGTTVDVRSYFQGESGETRLATKPDGLVGEQLLVFLRGLRGDVLTPGASRTVPFLPGPFERRLRHVAPQWGEARIARDAAPRTLEVPAGSFEAITYRVESSDGRRAVIDFESAYPHRLLAWSWERDGVVLDAGELAGSARLPYWQLHDEGQEELRAKLGLAD